jgi:hypothetical protein
LRKFLLVAIVVSLVLGTASVALLFGSVQQDPHAGHNSSEAAQHHKQDPHAGHNSSEAAQHHKGGKMSTYDPDSALGAGERHVYNDDDVVGSISIKGIGGQDYQAVKASERESGAIEYHVLAKNPLDLYRQSFYETVLPDVHKAYHELGMKVEPVVYFYENKQRAGDFLPLSVALLRKDHSYEVGFYVEKKPIRGHL